ncbi:MAG: single-stranded DNA-binding protein [Proteobacteria bacterium]|nr:single-stranded DNA-binding protein [Pseudomonadota bacterium]MCH9758787.1 single-stranded DNA-binding protein [Pseudomonadota bacterium]
MAYSKGSLNKVMLIGNLGADPELRTLPDGGAVANFVIATTEGWTDKNSNERKEQTEWHRITFFGRAAEIIHQYGNKGSKIYVEGTLRTRKWKDREGNDRYTTEVRGDDFTFLNFNRPDDGGGRGQGDNYSQEKQQSTDNVFNDIEDDDIPF